MGTRCCPAPAQKMYLHLSGDRRKRETLNHMNTLFLSARDFRRIFSIAPTGALGEIDALTPRCSTSRRPQPVARTAHATPTNPPESSRFWLPSVHLPSALSSAGCHRAR